MKQLVAGNGRGEFFSARCTEGGEDNIPPTEGYTVTFNLCRSMQRLADMRMIPRETNAFVTDREGLEFLYTQLGRFLNE